MSEHELKRKLDESFARKQDKYLRVKGWLGNNEGTVHVPGRDNYSYVIYETVSGSTVAAEVFNVRTPYTPLLAVWVGYDPDEPSRAWQVLGLRQSDGEESGGLLLGPHAETHRWLGTGTGGGMDWVPIELRQIMPFRVSPGGDLTINVYRGIYFDGTQWRLVEPAAPIDLASLAPVTADKAVIVLVTLDNAGDIITTAGSEFDMDSFAMTDIPAAPAGSKYIIGMVLLWDGQAEILEGRTHTDIIDPRFPIWHTHTSGESGGHDPVTLAADADTLLGLSGQELSLDSKSANTVLSGPTSGAATDPTFRALVAADVGTGTPDGTKFLRDDMSWQAAGGGSSYPPAWKFDIDETKGSSDTPDDDFDAGSLDGKWTVVNGSSGTCTLLRTTATAIYDLTTRSHFLFVQVGSSQTFEMRQDYTLPDGASIVLAISPALLADNGVTSNELWIGLALNNDDGGYDAGTWQGLFVDAEGGGSRILHYDGTSVWGVTTLDLNTLGRRWYFRIHRDGLTYYGFISHDGTTWMPVGQKTTVSAHDNIWIFVESKAAFGTPVPVQAFDFIRQGGSGIDPW